MILAHRTDHLCEKVKAYATHKNAGKTNRNIPTDFVHGMGNGKEEVGLRPTTSWGAPFVFLGRNGHDGEVSPDPLLLAPDPFSWHIARWTRRNLAFGYSGCR